MTFSLHNAPLAVKQRKKARPAPLTPPRKRQKRGKNDSPRQSGRITFASNYSIPPPFVQGKMPLPAREIALAPGAERTPRRRGYAGRRGRESALARSFSHSSSAGVRPILARLFSRAYPLTHIIR